MKKRYSKPILHIGKLLLIVLAFPFALAGVLIWAAVLLVKATANSVRLTVNSGQ